MIQIDLFKLSVVGFVTRFFLMMGIVIALGFAQQFILMMIAGMTLFISCLLGARITLKTTNTAKAKNIGTSLERKIQKELTQAA